MERHEAVRFVIDRLHRASIDEPVHYWQECLDALDPFWTDRVDDVNLSVGYLQSLARRDDEARDDEGRLSCIEEAEGYLWEVLRQEGGLTEAEGMEDAVNAEEASRIFGLDPDDGTFPKAL